MKSGGDCVLCSLLSPQISPKIEIEKGYHRYIHTHNLVYEMGTSLTTLLDWSSRRQVSKLGYTTYPLDPGSNPSSCGGPEVSHVLSKHYLILLFRMPSYSAVGQRAGVVAGLPSKNVSTVEVLEAGGITSYSRLSSTDNVLLCLSVHS